MPWECHGITGVMGMHGMQMFVALLAHFFANPGVARMARAHLSGVAAPWRFISHSSSLQLHFICLTDPLEFTDLTAACSWRWTWIAPHCFNDHSVVPVAQSQFATSSGRLSMRNASNAPCATAKALQTLPGRALKCFCGRCGDIHIYIYMCIYI